MVVRILCQRRDLTAGRQAFTAMRAQRIAQGNHVGFFHNNPCRIKHFTMRIAPCFVKRKFLFSGKLGEVLLMVGGDTCCGWTSEVPD